jgi:hypothetical protein
MNSVARTGTDATKFYEVTDRLGIERGWTALPRFAPVHVCAIRKCRACAHVECCRAWLAGATGVLTAPPRGCPNADLLVELLYDRPSAPAPRDRPGVTG